MTRPGAPRALVTGAGRGIGRAVAAELHKRGFEVVVAARQETDAERVAAELGGTARAVALDVTDDKSVGRCAERIGDVDVLVNNAGVLLDKGATAGAVPFDVVHGTLEVNLFGAWRVSRAFLPGMATRGWGRIVMVTSGTGLLGHGLAPRVPAYSLSKAAVNALTVLLAAEDSNVLVNAVNPGMVRTDMMPDAEGDPAAAAAVIASVADLPDDGPTGKLFRNGAVLPW